jgi:Holliday junction resolvasome RuvABC endonuclease subunit
METRFPTLLALDPSSTHVGWAFLESGPDGPIYVKSGTYKVPEAPPDQRVLLVEKAVRWIVKQSPSIEMALIEVPDFIASYAKPYLIYYFRAVGVAELTVHQLGLPIQYSRSSHAKKQARKKEGKVAFHRITNQYPLTDDQSDAFHMGWEFLSDPTNSLAIARSCDEDPFESDNDELDPHDVGSDVPDGFDLVEDHEPA